jgi:macrolide transport system ATP-binding/permease protein
MIVLENVSKTYLMGQTTVNALRGVSLHIKRGEFVSLVGASGSGKSTLLHMIGLLDRPDTGVLRIGGHDTAELPDDEISKLRSETIGFVFQQFHLLKRMTAFDNVELPLIYVKGDRPSADPASLLERVGLGNRGHHRPNELSGGQQQRVAIARALVRRPLVVLADEPTGNLDSHSGAEIMALLRELHAEGLTVVLVTHEPSIAAAADRTIRVHDGEIVEDIRKPAVPLPAATPAPGPITAVPELRMSRQLHWNLLLLNFQQAARGLWGNKLRTCLSALGIIIGVAAVIVMLALGHAAQGSVQRQIATLGSNRLVITPNSQYTGGVRQKPGAVSRLTLDEAMHIDGRVPTVSAVSGNVIGGVQAVYGHNNVSTSLIGAMPGYQEIYSDKPAYGRFFTLEECRLRARVALLGTTVLTGLFGKDNPVGQTIEINHVPFTVIGVLPSKGSNGSNDTDDVILVPLQTAMYRVLGKKFVDWIDTSASDASVVNDTVSKLQDLTTEWPHIPGVTSNSYRVFNMVAITQALSAVTTTLSIMLASVAAISLVVGGIGIMNIMLVSVTERTREIGLRKALGARRRDIQAQFLIESVTLCLGGGFLGIALGWIVSLIIGYFQGVWMNPSLISVVLSCGFSVAVGIGFGYWPAVLASRLDPIEALRYE